MAGDSDPAAAGSTARYVAIITDGNGRWAKARGVPVIEGHEAGADTVKARLRDAAELGRRLGEVSRTLTFYAVARAYPGVTDSYPGGFAGSLRRVLASFA